MKQLFFKHPNRKLEEQTFVRLRFGDDEVMELLNKLLGVQAG